MNDQCESYEVLISTWMDESLERDAQRELFDHFVRCETCRAFYRDARALEGLVAAASPASELAEQPSPEVWERIENKTAPKPPAEKRLAGLPSWALRAAAALVIGVALAFIPWPQSPARERSATSVELILEENRGSMTEVRFLELATELLRADRRYHFAMQEVMEKVIDDEWSQEGATSEGLTEESESDEGEGESSQYRV
jgi:hypothetical protein